ncbi:unnamed protein product [Acanthoscelides obtectus]|uniref:Uncharacterized protein n=1 Tax=Acanthoscelides obtectus TaxID=200917 RepID=A0A9P0L8A4_ACAOB|nr:unnamed protein product [Acanthoscelides obtectus]CAK1638323.1 hypothetical protein AOBTE_LOCUS10536 [Acanthoscelides obtectus]
MEIVLADDVLKIDEAEFNLPPAELGINVCGLEDKHLDLRHRDQDQPTAGSHGNFSSSSNESDLDSDSVPDNVYAVDDDIFDGNAIESDKANSATENHPWGDMNEGRKIKITADKNEWKRNKSKLLRMKGEDYLGFSRDKDKNFKHNTPRPARKLGMACVSKMCLKSKKRFCDTFTEDIRKEMFSRFWKKNDVGSKKAFCFWTCQPPASI